MPELPEVESIKLQLNKFLVGHIIRKIQINYQKCFAGDPEYIEGAKITGVRRFGKALVIDLSNNYSIIIHIKMTGQLLYFGPYLEKSIISKKITGGVPGKHTHVVFNLDKNGILYYNDMRKFGWIHVHKTDEVEKHKFISNLGKEFLKDIDMGYFGRTLSKSNQPIKVLIMDQSKMAGVGNIYANDALWLARINPKTPSKQLDNQAIEQLFKAIHTVLEAGIKYGGASELAFVTPDGAEGKYQEHTLVYGKQGTTCKNCKKQKIIKYYLAGRGTYWCPVCQN